MPLWQEWRLKSGDARDLWQAWRQDGATPAPLRQDILERPKDRIPLVM